MKSVSILLSVATLALGFSISGPNITTINEDKEGHVCFNKLGCFSVTSPWKSLTRPIPGPMSPETINTRVYFYARPDTKKRYEILLHPHVDLNGTPFDSKRPTTIIIHGFAANGNSSWMEEMKDALLSTKDLNVMLIDWGGGAQLFNYLQVSANTRVVGKEISVLIKELNIHPENIHLIGHSLGSHIASYAAKDNKKTARITALDPAQPAFEGFDSIVRLDKSDAEFVDVIHTDARPFIPTFGLGMMSKVGHVDFYVNGGFDQPGCIIPDPKKLPKITSLLDLAKYPVEVIAEIVACPHGRAIEYFIEAVNHTKAKECIFWGHQASVEAIARTLVNTLSQGVASKVVALKSTCSKHDCTPLGPTSIESQLRGAFVVSTRGWSPFCIFEKGVSPEDESSTVSILGKIPNPFKSLLSLNI